MIPTSARGCWRISNARRTSSLVSPISLLAFHWCFTKRFRYLTWRNPHLCFSCLDAAYDIREFPHPRNRLIRSLQGSVPAHFCLGTWNYWCCSKENYLLHKPNFTHCRQLPDITPFRPPWKESHQMILLYYIIIYILLVKVATGVAYQRLKLESLPSSFNDSNC